MSPHVRPSVVAALTTLFAFSFCFLTTGCEGPRTTWSTESRSPDGHWLATAQSQQWSGPGNAYDATRVYLAPVVASRARTKILLFFHQFPTMNLEIRWSTPTHLDVTYAASATPGDHVSLDFEVVKFSGIEISAREIAKVDIECSADSLWQNPADGLWLLVGIGSCSGCCGPFNHRFFTKEGCEGARAEWGAALNETRSRQAKGQILEFGIDVLGDCEDRPVQR